MRTTYLFAVFLWFADAVVAQTPTSTKKLIEFGWDQPDTTFLRTHIREMEKTPFDGTVFSLPGDFLWNCWSSRAFTEAEIAAGLDDLRNTKLERFTHNLLRFNVTPGSVDWFDDFAPIVQNARLAAKAARVGKAAGILFDVEQYNAPLFHFAKQRDAKTKSWEEYASKVRERGREIMTAFQAEFPDLVLLTTWGYSLPVRQTKGDESKLAETEYGLLKPFLDGLFDAAAGKTKIVDGYESSYGYKGRPPFLEARQVFERAMASWKVDRDRLRRHGSFGFGVWMDYDWRRKGWDERDFSKNHFTPDQFQHSVMAALEVSDEYVWVYTEKPRWWTPPHGKPAALPRDYELALRAARERVIGAGR